MDAITNRPFQAKARFTLRNVLNFPVPSSYLQDQIQKSSKTFDASQYTRYRQLVSIRRNL